MREVLEVVDIEVAIPMVAMVAMGGGMIADRMRKRFR